MDLSDGLLGDVGKLGYASGLSARILVHHLPMPPALPDCFGEEARDLALAGGEDFELLVAGDAETLEAAARVLRGRGLAPLTIVGRLEDGEPGKVVIENERGQVITPPRTSWDHFRREPGP
jgi:thiamine-monophosphate kinase